MDLSCEISEICNESWLGMAKKRFCCEVLWMLQNDWKTTILAHSSTWIDIEGFLRSVK